MNYQNFDLIDFMMDEAFQEWVLNPTLESQKFWENWVRDNPDKVPVIQKARAIILDVDFEESNIDEFNKEKILQNIKAVINTETLTEELNILKESKEFHEDDEIGEKLIYSLPTQHSIIKRWHKAAIAASVSLIVMMGIWLVISNTQQVFYSTNFGETKTFNLPDGSEVVLSANSSISYEQKWQGEHDREIDLKGEAFFSVVHTENDQKFIVHSNGVAIEVLGTEFNVNNRRGKTQVVLQSGKVKLNLNTELDKHSAETILNMEPGELVEISEKDQKVTKRVVNPEKYALWTKDVLVFDSVPLKEVFNMIQDMYGYNVTVKDSGIENKIFEAEISSKDIDLIIEIIAQSFMLDIKKQGNELIVRKI
ncbi:transmembrane sensor [Catalinimonas alkaloidigena]|uniref:FecR family protein n=1 Tax=Catalinimonas alkaloidigena TaxID=1075417 RepID=UPI0024073268|nr:FecR family protein [Catalinimonas alkaloidigena]MDF9798859.1 transmembrane sensor [Catalinimonas alkaloidigena]